MTTYAVRDGVRTRQFDGTMLSESSSRVGTRPRWVEFRLYKTLKGTYVLSRTGMSVYFHAEECSVVGRNRLSATDGVDLGPEYIPCPDCKPSRILPDGVYPETPRYWLLSSDTAKGVIVNLMKYDENGVEYLTNVARRLLEDASEVDDKIRGAFFTDTIE